MVFLLLLAVIILDNLSLLHSLVVYHQPVAYTTTVVTVTVTDFIIQLCG